MAGRHSVPCDAKVGTLLVNMLASNSSLLKVVFRIEEMMKRLLGAFLMVVMSTISASAEVLICTYTDSKGGALTGVTTSWLGRKFALDTERNLVQRQWSDGQEKPVKVDKIIKAPRFKTYKVDRRMKDVQGNESNISYSFRIYEDGRCSARWQEQGYRDMIADGFWEKR